MYLWIHFIFSWVTLVPFQIHPNGGATTSCSTEAENDARIIGKYQANTLQHNHGVSANTYKTHIKSLIINLLFDQDILPT